MTPWGFLTKGVKTRKKLISLRVIFKRRPRRIECSMKTKSYRSFGKDYV